MQSFFLATEPLCLLYFSLLRNKIWYICVLLLLFMLRTRTLSIFSYIYISEKNVLYKIKYFICSRLTMYFSDYCTTLQNLLHEEPYTAEEIEKITGQSLTSVFQSSQTSLAVLRAAKHYKLFQVHSISFLCFLTNIHEDAYGILLSVTLTPFRDSKVCFPPYFVIPCQHD